MPLEPRTSFLNVDLDLQGEFDLEPLLAGFGDDVVVVSRFDDDGQRHAALELSSELHQPYDAQTAVLGFARLVAALPPELRERWDAAGACLNVGVQAGRQPYAEALSLSAEAVAAAAAIGARIELTVYGAEVDEPSPS
ncbi:MAG: hypothetical protein ABMA64_23275 [Myxococcota bacterium]